MNMWLIHLLIVFLISNNVLARDLGKQATDYDIAEEGFVNMMKRRLSYLNIAEHQKQMKEIAIKRVEEPKAVGALVKTKKEREFYYDPTYTLEEDIKLPCGKIIYYKGTKANPLDYMDFDRELIFVDGRDKKQLEWLKEYIRGKETDNRELKKAKGKIEERIILTGGKILELQEDIGKALYFDQAGELTNKFGIKQLPAVVIQDGKKLKIKEIKVGISYE
jgi:conjugal transfer pilus assembly protein TraW